MGIERALGAGAGELDRGRRLRGQPSAEAFAAEVRTNPSVAKAKGTRAQPKTKRTRTQRRGKGTRAQRRPNPTAVKIERTRAQGKAKGTRASWKSERTQAYVRFQWLCAGRPARSRRCKSVAMKE
jgi:hypothetical protein